MPTSLAPGPVPASTFDVSEVVPTALLVKLVFAPSGSETAASTFLFPRSVPAASALEKPVSPDEFAVFWLWSAIVGVDSALSNSGIGRQSQIY